MCYCAWLHTPPRKDGKLLPARIKEIAAGNGQPSYPERTLYTHLSDYLFDVGPTQAGGMGAVAISHGELVAWQHNKGIEISAWDASTLRRLSHDYLAASQAAEDPNCPSPAGKGADEEFMRAGRVKDGLRSFLH